jgi:hypothetical protein
VSPAFLASDSFTLPSPSRTPTGESGLVAGAAAAAGGPDNRGLIVGSVIAALVLIALVALFLRLALVHHDSRQPSLTDETNIDATLDSVDAEDLETVEFENPDSFSESDMLSGSAVSASQEDLLE